MAIEIPILSSNPIEVNTDITLEMLSVRPESGVVNDTAVIPNKLFAYYDSFSDAVELYMSDASGYRMLKIV